MSLPTKDKAHVLANPVAFNEAYARACEVFGKIEGVVDVAFGQKRTGSEYQDNIAIVVFVREKKDEQDIPPEERIPPSFEGYPTDVRVVRKAEAQGCDNTTKYDKIQGGIQIMVKQGFNAGQGTLGCIVKKRHDSGRENVYLLTNKHVLYSHEAGAKDTVYHPTPDDESLGPIQEGGLYDNFPYPLSTPGAPLYFIDAAIARINLDSTCCGSTCTKDTIHVDETLIADLQVKGVNSIADVRDVTADPLIVNKKVFKVGRTTGKTTGFVRLVNVPLDADPEPDKVGGPRIAALRTIYIEFDATAPGAKNCKGHQLFTEGGDSGSVVVDEEGRVIGLHSHGGKAIAPFTLSPSYACHIVPVLDHLNICIPTTTGTSHGSSKATDGSGLKPPAVSPTANALVDGQIAFSSASAASVASRSPGFPDLTPLADEEILHMRELLRLLRETEKGRELHGVFGQLRREVGYLIRNCRPVKVAWHRNQGPAFFAHVLNHLKGHACEVPREVKGISPHTLMTRMADVLSRHGSNPLRRAIEQYREEFLEVVPSLTSVPACIEYLREKENA